MLLRRVMLLLLALSLLSVNLPAAAQRPVPPDHDPKQTSMVDLPPQAPPSAPACSTARRARPATPPTSYT